VYKKFLSGDVAEADSSILFKAIEDYLKEANIQVDFGCEEENIMEADVSNRLIIVNPKYYVLTSSEVGTIAESRCLCMLIVKLLHEVAHLLTSTFHKLSGLGISPFALSDTPPKIGTIYVKNSVKGDCGFGMEEDLLGGRLVLSLGSPYYDQEVTMALSGGKGFVQLKDSYIQQVLSFFNSNGAKPQFDNDRDVAGLVKKSSVLGKKPRRSSTTGNMIANQNFSDSDEDDDDINALTRQVNHISRRSFLGIKC